MSKGEGLPIINQEIKSGDVCITRYESAVLWEFLDTPGGMIIRFKDRAFPYPIFTVIDKLTFHGRTDYYLVVGDGLLGFMQAFDIHVMRNYRSDLANPHKENNAR